MATLNKVGRRFYIEGTPFAAKDVLKDAGCRWDGERRAWWTGKKDIADTVMAKLAEKHGAQVATPDARDEKVDINARVIRGRVTYKGKTYYLLAERRDGTGAKVCFRDGSRIFWTKQGEPFSIEKMYEEPRSISGLKAFAERKKQEKQEYGYNPVYGRDYCGYPCPVDGHVCTPDAPCHDCQ